MAKRIDPKSKTARTSGKTEVFKIQPLEGKNWLFTNNVFIQAFIVVLIGGIFYFNSINNKYALDDDIIMKENMYVQKGFAGIGDIMGNDAYKSYYESMGVDQQLAGGRYRPLSIVSFAIEQQLFGECYGARFTEVRDSLFLLQKLQINDANYFRLTNEKNLLERQIKDTNIALAKTRHGFQIFWFLLAMVALLVFLRECIFRENTDIAFLATLLFTIHPIHTEVVANVKSRDEIFSLLFICLTFIFFFRYDISKKGKDLALGCLNFFLAMLSKEYAFMLIGLIPAGLMIFHKRKVSEVILPVAAIAGVLVLYTFVRFSAVGGAATAPVNKASQDPLNDPYMYATSEQRMASKLNRFDDYLWLLIFPHPLVSDYSYQHFAYSRFSDPMVWLSFFVNIGLVVLMFRLWMKRHPMAFALMIYFAFFILINNMFFDIGATMGERLIFHSSVGFCMAVAWLLIKGLEKIEIPRNIALAGIFVLLAIPAFLATSKRNLEWMDDFTLFSADVKKHPNSALTNGNAGARYMDRGLGFLGHDSITENDTIRAIGRDMEKVNHYADTAIGYLTRATEIHKKYVNGYLNLGLCYFYKDQYEQAAEAWGSAYQYFPSNNILVRYKDMLTAKANDRAAKKDYIGAARFMYCAATSVPGDAKAWGDYAGSSYMAKDFTGAKNAFYRSLSIVQGQIKQLEAKTPLAPEERDLLMRLKQQEAGLQNGYGAAFQNERALNAFRSDSANADSVLRLASSLTGTEFFYPESRRLVNKALTIRPGDQNANRLLDSLSMLEARVEWAKDSANPDKILKLAESYSRYPAYAKEARRILAKLLKMQPGNARAAQLLNSIAAPADDKKRLPR